MASRNAIMRYKDVASLSSQEKNALEVITKLVSITDEGIRDITNPNGKYVTSFSPDLLVFLGCIRL
jgi:hypothetical protein